MTGLLRLFRNILILLILFWGVLAAVIRLGTPYLEHVREPIADWLSDSIGQRIQIGELQASWYGLAPELRLRDVRIGDAEEALGLGSVELDFSPKALFSRGIVSSLRLTLSGLDLQLLRQPNGQIQLLGLPVLADREAQEHDFELPRHIRIRQARLLWTDLRSQAPPLQLENINLQLLRSGEQLQLQASVRSSAIEADFSADIHGKLISTTWSARSFLHIHKLAVNEQLAAYVPQHYRISKGGLSLKLWQQWQDALPLHSQGELGLRDVELSNTASKPQRFRVERFDSGFYFARSGENWLLALDDPELKLEGESVWALGRVALRQRMDADAQPYYRVAAEHVRVSSLLQLLLIRPPHAEIPEWLSALRPQVELHDVLLSYQPGEAPSWQLNSRFSDLGWNAWGDVPGIRGLQGDLQADQDALAMQLSAQNTKADVRPLFREAIPVLKLDGQLYGKKLHDGWRLSSSPMYVDTGDIQTHVRFALSQQAQQPMHLTVQSYSYDGDARMTSRYLPAGIMHEDIVSWLDQSIVEGGVEQVHVLIDGPLNTFPYHETRNGVFEVLAIVRDVPLDYQYGWPALQDVDAELHFHENTLDITMLQGKILDTSIHSAKATIDSLWPTSPLRVVGRVDGPLANMLRVLRFPAMSKDFGHIAEALKAKGAASINLDFTVPLDSEIGDYLLDGQLRFRNSAISLQGWDLDIKKVRGNLQLGLDAIRAQGLAGEALGSKVWVDVRPQKDGSTLVAAKARLNEASIRRQLPMLPAMFEGASDFAIELQIPGVSAAKNAPTALRVSSDLRGMKVNLPHPLGKARDTRRDLAVSLAVAGEPQPIRFRYGKQLKGLLSADTQRGDVRFAQGEPMLPSKGYHIKASLPVLDVNAWQQAFEGQPKGTGSLPDWQAELEVGSLLIDSLTLPTTALVLQGSADAIDGVVTGKQLAGRFHYPLDVQKLAKVDLRYLHLSFDSDDEDSPLPVPAGPDPSQLPSLSLQCEDLRINQAELGTFVLQTLHSPAGQVIRQLSLTGPHMAVSGSGDWSLLNGVPQTRLKGRVDAPDLGGLLTKLGFAQHVEESSGALDFDWTWPGNPAQWHLGTVGGTASLALDKGRLSEVDPGVARVVGLLSLDALTRRLKLDFDDLLKKGYTFDSIEGDFVLEDGHTTSRNLLVVGPTGRIEIGGRIGLLSEDFELLVNVVPNLDATLTIASTLAGGPVAGIAALLAQELLAKEVDQINRFEYVVTGSWDEPAINALDTGGPLSKFINALKGEKSEAPTPQQEAMQPQQAPSKGALQRLLDKLGPSPDEQGDEAVDSGVPALAE